MRLLELPSVIPNTTGVPSAPDRNPRRVLQVAKQALGKAQDPCWIDLPARRQDKARGDELVAKPVATVLSRDRAQGLPPRPSTAR